MENTNPVILVVEDEESHIALIYEAFQISSDTYELVSVNTIHDAKKYLNKIKPDLILTDLNLPDGEGNELLPGNTNRNDIPIIIMTGQGGEKTAVEAIKNGALDYVIKSSETLSDMPHIVKRSLREWRHIEEKQQSELALKESEKRYRSLFNGVPIGLYRSKPDGTLIEVNEALVDILRYPDQKTLLTRKANEGYANEALRIEWQSLIESCGVLRNFETQWLCYDGSLIWIRENANCVFDESGKIQYYEGSVEDITEKKNAELAVKSTEEKYCDIVNLLPQIVFECDTEGKLTFVNKKAFELFQYEKEDLANGVTVLDVIVAEDIQRVYENLKRRLQGEDLKTNIYTAKRKDGSEFPISIYSSVVYKNSQPIGLRGIIIDTTDQLKVEETLKAAKEAAEMANETKSQFLANISHELRTPMNGIIGMTDLTLETDLELQQREYLTIVKESSESLLHLLNSILDFSKIEAGRMEVDETSFVLRSVVDTIVGNLSAQVKQKEIEFTSTIGADVPHEIIGDPGKLSQILVNVLGNAVKFTETGSVNLKIIKDADKTGDIFKDLIPLKFIVTDTGIGIAKDKISRIFDSFEQGDGSYTRKYGGTGLGLAITKELVQLINGNISVTSEVTKGSVFTIELPFKNPEFSYTTTFVEEANKEASNVSDVVPEESNKSFHILLAEDDLINQKVARDIIRSRGYSLDIVCDGKEVLNILKSKDYDLIFMDVQMLEMDGIETTRYIRLSDGKDFDPNIPIVALTAHALKSDQMRCLEAGMNEFLTKPIHAKRLIETIEKYKNNENDRIEKISQNCSDGTLFAIDEVLERLDGDLELYNKLKILFLNSCPKLLQNMKNVFNQKDYQTLANEAHSIKAGAANIGDEYFFNHIVVLEEHIKNKDDRGIKKSLSIIQNDFAKSIVDTSEVFSFDQS